MSLRNNNHGLNMLDVITIISLLSAGFIFGLIISSVMSYKKNIVQDELLKKRGERITVQKKIMLEQKAEIESLKQELME